MATIYETLRWLAACGWRQEGGWGDVRLLTHPARPGVRLVVRGSLRQQLPEEVLEQILRHALPGEEP